MKLSAELMDLYRSINVFRAIVSTSPLSIQTVQAMLLRSSPGEHYVISDGGSDTTIVGNGWLVVAQDTYRVANLVGFDAIAAKKRGLPIVTALTIAFTDEDERVLLRAHEAVFNKGSSTSLLSEYQTRQFGCIVDSVSKKHRTFSGHGLQCFSPADDIKLPLSVRSALMVFRCEKPTEHDLSTLTPIDITSSDPWKPASFHDDPDDIDPLLVNTTTADIHPTGGNATVRGDNVLEIPRIINVSRADEEEFLSIQHNR